MQLAFGLGPPGACCRRLLWHQHGWRPVTAVLFEQRHLRGLCTASVRLCVVVPQSCRLQCVEQQSCVAFGGEGWEASSRPLIPPLRACHTVLLFEQAALDSGLSCSSFSLEGSAALCGKSLEWESRADGVGHERHLLCIRAKAGLRPGVHDSRCCVAVDRSSGWAVASGIVQYVSSWGVCLCVWRLL